MSARWKRNAVVAVMAVLVCSAVALNWLYTGQEVQEASGGKLLGEAQLVSGKGTEKTGEEEKTGEGEQAAATLFLRTPRPFTALPPNGCAGRRRPGPRRTRG